MKQLTDDEKLQLVASMALFMLRRSGLSQLQLSYATIDEALEVDWNIELTADGLILQTFPKDTYQAKPVGKGH